MLLSVARTSRVLLAVFAFHDLGNVFFKFLFKVRVSLEGIFTLFSSWYFLSFFCKCSTRILIL